MSEHISVETVDGIATIRFDRPERKNALTARMYEAVSDALVLGESDSHVRAFLFAGAPGAFTAGSDVSEFLTYSRDGKVGSSVLRFTKTLATLDKPVIAAVDGLAIGMGTLVLLLCDYVVASDWSVFSVPNVDRGFVPEAAATLLAPRVMGFARAFELLVMGEEFDAAEAVASGIVNRVVPAEDVEMTAMAIAMAIASKPQESVRQVRRLMRGDRRDLVQRIDMEAAGYDAILLSQEAHDAMEAFISNQL